MLAKGARPTGTHFGTANVALHFKLDQISELFGTPEMKNHRV